MSGDREWLRMAKPEHGRAGKARQPIQSRAPVGLTVLSRLREVARRAGNHVVQRYAEEEAFWAPAQVERAIDLPGRRCAARTYNAGAHGGRFRRRPLRGAHS